MNLWPFTVLPEPPKTKILEKTVEVPVRVPFTTNPIQLPELTMPIALLGLAVGVLAIGLFIGSFINKPNTSSRAGYSISRDDRGRITEVMPVPVPF